MIFHKKEFEDNDNVSNAHRAEILTEALPYIRKHSGKTIVVKYGGNAMVDDNLKKQVMEDVVLLWLVGVRVVLVHGGGPDVSQVMKAMGKKPEFVDGLRVTDEETIDIVKMVLGGKVNKDLVNLLQSNGGNAVGLSGIDGKLIETEKRDDVHGYVGHITKVNIGVIEDLLDNGYIPVISTIGCDGEGNAYNINGDTAAAYIAGALGASRLIMMTDIDGILTDKNDPDTLIAKISVAELQKLYDEGESINGGMLPKVRSCIDAIEQGTDKVIVMDGRVPHSILMELFTDEGAGTMIIADNKYEE